MHEPEVATDLAKTLVEIANQFGRGAKAIVSDMNEPLGRSIGTGLEVIEARDFLRGSDIPRVRELCLLVAQTMLALAGVDDGQTRTLHALESGEAYEKLIELVEAQGASRAGLEAMKRPGRRSELTAQTEGFVQAIDAASLGNIAREWAGNDALAGIRVNVRIGDRVERGDVLAELYGAGAAPQTASAAFAIAPQAPPAHPLIYAVL